MRYRSFLTKFRHETQKSSPGSESGVKKIFELLNSTPTYINKACWRRTGVKRLSSFQVRIFQFKFLIDFKDGEDADRESPLLNMMKNLEIEEKEKREREAEDDEAQETPVTQNPLAYEKKRKQSRVYFFTTSWNITMHYQAII